MRLQCDELGSLGANLKLWERTALNWIGSITTFGSNLSQDLCLGAPVSPHDHLALGALVVFNQVIQTRICRCYLELR